MNVTEVTITEITPIQESQPEVTIKEVTPKKPVITTPVAILIGAGIIAIAVLIVGANKKNNAVVSQQGAQGQQQQQPVIPTSVNPSVAKIRASDYVRGDKNAPIVVIEYADSDCYYCGQFHPTMQQVMKDYDGKVAWVYRPFPIVQLHPNAQNEAQALMCVGKLVGSTGYWNYLDTIINITLKPDPKSNLPLYTYAEGLGISKTDMTNCMTDKTITKQIADSVQEAETIGAQGTPFSIAVNTKTGKQAIIPGAYPLENVKQAIDSILK